MTYVTLENVPLKVKPTIQTDFQIKTSIKNYVGGYGSHTTRTGQGGRKIEFTVLAKEHDIDKIKKLKDLPGPLVMVSESKANYNGLYHLIDFKIGEKKKGIYDVNISLQEYSEFNITKQSFTNWELPKKTTTTTTPTTNTTTNKASSSSSYSILKKCPTLRYGSSSTNCVKELQRFLKKCGHYTYVNGHYLMIDGIFGTYTRAAVKRFQKKKGLTQDGVVGPSTKAKMTSC